MIAIIVLMTIMVALLSFIALRKQTFTVLTIQEESADYLHERKTRSDKGKKRGTYKKGKK
jgi:hypothetical protein